MRHSFIYTELKPVLPYRAYGYSVNKATSEYSCYEPETFESGASSTYMSAWDLYMFWKNLISKRIIKQNNKELMFSKQASKNETNHFYGYGWHLKYHGRKKIIYHTGSDGGFRNLIVYYPDVNIVIIFLSNNHTFEKEYWFLATKIIGKLNIINANHNLVKAQDLNKKSF